MLEADSFDCSNAFRVPSTINEITEADINEVTQGCWNNNGNYGNKHGSRNWNKQQNYKGKKDFDKKPWQNKDQKPWNKDQKSQYGTKDSKPKDACITVTKDVKYFCPTGYDEGIFSAVTKLLSGKIEQAKWSGDANAKTINAIKCEASVIFSKFQNNYMMQLLHR